MSDVHALHETDQVSAVSEVNETEATSSREMSDARPTFDEIAREAYAIYLANGSQDGRDLEDWLEAERRLAAQRSHAPQLSNAVVQQLNGESRQKSARPIADRRRNTRHPVPTYLPV